jgi:hypothetical protein
MTDRTTDLAIRVDNLERITSRAPEALGAHDRHHDRDPPTARRRDARQRAASCAVARANAVRNRIRNGEYTLSCWLYAIGRRVERWRKSFKQ